LEADEVNIISGALELKKKTVEDIMTRLEDIFMLPLEGLLDFEMLNEIRKQGKTKFLLLALYSSGIFQEKIFSLCSHRLLKNSYLRT